MVGVAAERVFLQVCSSTLEALEKEAEKEKFTKVMSGREVNGLCSGLSRPTSQQRIRLL